MTAMPTSSASGGRSVTFLLREPRQTQGFREALRLTPSGVAPFETFVDEGDDSFDKFVAEELALPNKPLSLTMLWIPPGRFWMGSPPTELERGDFEGPMHLLQMQGFFMSQTPITQAQWRQVVRSRERPGENWGRKLNTKPSRFQEEDSGLFPGEANTDNRPVEQVSWLDAMEFCSRLSQRTGRNYTLPSEAQWEYACRAGTTTPFCFGDTISPELANYVGNHAYADGPTGTYRKQTTPVGMYPANAWGLQDMQGNVWEWCLDEWHESYEGAPSDGRAWVDAAEGEKSKESVKTRLLRGGSWDVITRYCRSAYRDHAQPDNANNNVGFRVVCSPQSPSFLP
jgi:formylglycine-generating enzyme required for sulfatase activity